MREQRRGCTSVIGQALLRWGLAASCGLALAACGSSNPAAPSTPSVPQALTIKGPVAFTIGQTSQLAAVLSTGQDVTIGATWKSSDSSVARISTTGLLTAMGAGTAAIAASFQAASGTSTVTVTPVFLSSTIATCGIILNSGNYQVAADLSLPPSFGPCLQVRAGAIQLDCRQHMISMIQLSGVNDVTVTNCARGTFVDVDNSTNVTIAHNTLLEILLSGGSGNRVLDNTIDGGYDGSGGQVGQDDGIVVADEANDMIQRNIIRNVFDAGIEGLDVVADSDITDNTIVNAAVAGIASYWCTNWTGNIVGGNSVSGSSWMVDFIYEVGLGKCVNLSTPGAFQNNRIIGNRFTSPNTRGGGMNFNFPTLPAGTVIGNFIQGNDLGAASGPFVNPASGFLDGGGNICAPGTSPFCGGEVGMARLAFLVDTYRTERLKTLGVWSQVPDARMTSRPEARARTPLEHMVHQCLSEDAWMKSMLGIATGLPALPADESRLSFLEHYAACSQARLLELETKDDAWFDEMTPFFDVPRTRAWIIVRRLTHSAHHRGQLTANLRAWEEALYSTYGPTADTGGLPKDGARVIYRYASIDELLEQEAAGGARPPLAPVRAAVTERPNRSESSTVPRATQLRVARPSDDLDALVRFYRDGLGFHVIDEFHDHDGFDGVMLGHAGSAYHLEFTRRAGHDAGRAPTNDHLLVFYLPDVHAWQASVDRMIRAGYPPVPAGNPFWNQDGKTFEDPDGYRVVLQQAGWPR
jgi:catechol 2,3-dioxygenase-like lactoylglutathione lyase family enzyme/uncharacterized damage-inducible protein DinB